MWNGDAGLRYIERHPTPSAVHPQVNRYVLDSQCHVGLFQVQKKLQEKSTGFRHYYNMFTVSDRRR